MGSCLQQFTIRIRKQEMKAKCKKTKSVRFFFLQNKNKSGSGDVVSAPKRKTFVVAKKNVLKRDGQGSTA